MLHDIDPHIFNNEFVPDAVMDKDDYVFHFAENKLLLKQAGNNFELPKLKDLSISEANVIYLFALNNVKCFLVWNCEEPDNKSFVYHELNYFRTISQKDLDWTATVAFQLKSWYDENKFCGKCGGSTIYEKKERGIFCPSCQVSLYPKISPAIIVAIFKGDKILLARGSRFRESFFSLVAGYVDIGESIEETVIREVKEEVGISIKNLRYYKSQPWPYSGSMMIGFIAEADDDQVIEIDNREIVEAAWFSRGNLPKHPNERSIAGEIIDKFDKGEPL